MKREILFRGKRVDTNEWVYGYYVCLNEAKHFIYTGYAETDCGNYYPDYYEVIPETVGQYICMSDKHGTKLFEGDVIDIEYVDFTRRYWVKYKEDRAWYALEPVPRRFVDEWLDHDTITYSSEIIGNIYDNPELYEVTND
jgi:uncharacterized phage protein (TIGR01671 family)